MTKALGLLTQSYDDILEAFGSALDLNDMETADHSQRVTAYTISIAKSVPVPLQYLSVLARAAFLHDLGKMAIPDSILRRPGPLGDSEKRIMRTHCGIGYNTRTRIPFLREAADIVSATMSSSMIRAIRVACAVNKFLSGHSSSLSPMLSMPC